MARRFTKWTVTVAAALTALVTGAGTANAYPGPTQRCYPGMACFYYNSNMAGALATFYDGGNGNLDGQIFDRGSGNGGGKPVKNNAASVDSRKTSTYYCIHFNSNWKGAFDILPPQYKMNLSATYNNNASTNWYPRHENGGGH